MKIKLHIKDPDVLNEAIAEAVEKDVSALNLPEDERETIEEKRREKVGELCATWFKWGEYFCIEVDTDTKTARVVTVDESSGW